MKPTCVVFDIGGVLTYIDKSPIHKLCKSQNVAPHVFFDSDFLKLQCGMISIKDFFITKSLVLHVAACHLEVAFAAMLPHGAPDVLARLHVPFILASNINEFHFRRFISLSQNLPYSPPAILSYQVGHLKPSGLFFSSLTKALPFKACEIVFIDDNPDNTDTAGSFGMQTALCPSPEYLPHLLKRLELVKTF